MHSCIYEGTVRHQRRKPILHDFRYRLNMLYLDLDELPTLVDDRLISDRRLSFATFRADDHATLTSADEETPMPSSAKELRHRVSDYVARESGVRVGGPIRLLTQLRYCGYYFSPLNLYYCFDSVDEQVVAVVAEVSNTPWREQHTYVLHAGNRTEGGQLSFAHAKRFHVSPFMNMAQEYRWSLTLPGDSLTVNLSNRRAYERTTFFDAQLNLMRRELTQRSLSRMLVRYPVMTAQIMGAIYFQALKLWWKACPYYPHPKSHSNCPQTQKAS